MNIQKYEKYLEPAMKYYYDDGTIIKYFNRLPKNRYYTFAICIEYLNNIKNPIIIELGTTRSYVDGRFEGCNVDDIKYWNPNDMEKWDWSAGFFTYIFGEYVSQTNGTLHTVDICPTHINMCKNMTEQFKNNINYHISSSEDFLNNFEGQADIIYLDTGDMTPIEQTAQLQLSEIKIIVERNLLKPTGYILIDDVRNVTPKDRKSVV